MPSTAAIAPRPATKLPCLLREISLAFPSLEVIARRAIAVVRSILSIPPATRRFDGRESTAICVAAAIPRSAGRLDRRRQPLVTKSCRGCWPRRPSADSTSRAGEVLTPPNTAGISRRNHPEPRRGRRAGKTASEPATGRPVSDAALACWSCAGIGCTVKAFEQQGHAASGIEPERRLPTLSREQLRADVPKAYPFDLPPACERSGAARPRDRALPLAADALDLHKLIPQDGLLYVECPNLARSPLCAKTFHFAHITISRREALATMARRTGFEVERCSSQPHAPILQSCCAHGATNLTIPADGLQQTMAAYHRYSLWSYYLRPNYLAARLVEVLDKSWSGWPLRGMCVAFWPSASSRGRNRFRRLVARPREHCHRHGQPANRIRPLAPGRSRACRCCAGGTSARTRPTSAETSASSSISIPRSAAQRSNSCSSMGCRRWVPGRCSAASGRSTRPAAI